MIPVSEPSIGEEELENVKAAVKSGWIGSKGNFIEKFEEEFSKKHERKYGVSTSNGTAALHLALRALGIGEGDEVIVPTLTFISVVNAVAYCNATPVFVDADPEYWCIDPQKIEERIGEKTKVIIPVHLYGHPCNMGTINEIAEKHNLKIIEDAAEAHGSEYKNEKVGSFGEISCFSFYCNKTITTGEGGICLTDQEELEKKLEILKNHGMNPNRKYWHDLIGYNYRMTNLQAAVGVAQIKKLPKFVKKKRKIASFYSRELKELEQENKIELPPEKEWAKNTYWMYSILVNSGERKKLIDGLTEKGIETRPFFYPAHKLPIYKSNYKFPISENLSKRGLNLPSAVTLKKKEVEKVGKRIREILL